MNERQARTELMWLTRSLVERGYSVGSAGNISVAVEDGLLNADQFLARLP